MLFEGYDLPKSFPFNFAHYMMGGGGLMNPTNEVLNGAYFKFKTCEVFSQRPTKVPLTTVFVFMFHWAAEPTLWFSISSTCGPRVKNSTASVLNLGSFPEMKKHVHGKIYLDVWNCVEMWHFSLCFPPKSIQYTNNYKLSFVLTKNNNPPQLGGRNRVKKKIHWLLLMLESE